MRARPRSRRRPFAQAHCWLMLGLGALACEPEMFLGELVDTAGGVAGNEPSESGAAGEPAGGMSIGGAAGESGDAAGGAFDDCSMAEGGAFGKMENGVYNDGPLPAPWESGFEDGFCSYRLDAGFCYADPESSFRLVQSPAHSGELAAAFEIGVDGATGNHQTRCVREGQLPTEAYYGAWFYLPELASDPNNWNLVHFQGGEPGGILRTLWDVSLDVMPSGELEAYVAGGVPWRIYRQATPLALPIRRWFQLELYFKRAADRTGELALFQDGEEVIRVTDIATDDTEWAQWYVGNLAESLSPSNFTLYVDDVTVRLGP